MAHHVAGAQPCHSNGVVTVGGDKVEHACRDAGSQRQLARSQTVSRGQLCGLDDDGAPRSQRRRNFARDRQPGESSKRDGSARRWAAEHEQAAVVVKLRQRLAIDALGLLGKPFHKAGTVGNLAFGLGIGLALLCRQDACQIILVGHEQVKPFAQDATALFGSFVAPGAPNGVAAAIASCACAGAKLATLVTSCQWLGHCTSNGWGQQPIARQ